MPVPLALRATVVIALCLLGTLAVAVPALAGPEEELAEKYAPVVRLVEQTEECGHGEPYLPTDVDVLFDEPTVALRGPWNRTDLVKIAPDGDRPRRPLRVPPRLPGQRARSRLRLRALGAPPHGGDEADRLRPRRHRPRLPGQARAPVLVLLPLQRLQQHARGRLGDDPARLRRRRRARGAREGADRGRVQLRTRAPSGPTWGDEKLEIVDGTHPVVYPAAGSHANKFTAALYLGSSADAGVGCDDTVGPHRELRPVVKTIPSDSGGGGEAFPWIAFEGRWGELQKAFFNGPTGPNLKTQWTTPDRVVGGLARPELRGARGRRLRHERDRPLLQRRREGLEGARRSCSEPAARRCSSLAALLALIVVRR